MVTVANEQSQDIAVLTPPVNLLNRRMQTGRCGGGGGRRLTTALYPNCPWWPCPVIRDTLDLDVQNRHGGVADMVDLPGPRQDQPSGVERPQVSAGIAHIRLPESAPPAGLLFLPDTTLFAT